MKEHTPEQQAEHRRQMIVHHERLAAACCNPKHFKAARRVRPPKQKLERGLAILPRALAGSRSKWHKGRAAHFGHSCLVDPSPTHEDGNRADRRSAKRGA